MSSSSSGSSMASISAIMLLIGFFGRRRLTCRRRLLLRACGSSEAFGSIQSNDGEKGRSQVIAWAVVISRSRAAHACRLLS